MRGARFLAFGISAYDLPTRDKIPAIRELMAAKGDGLALDIGSGTGYATHAVFESRPTICVDLHRPNLCYYRRKMASILTVPQPLCVVANAAALPFRDRTFRYALCSEVLEHLENDDAAVRELGRVLAVDGTIVITVPYNKLGFTSFLELCGIKTVHDFPGPEQHVRSGYDERSLKDLLARHGLEIERHTYYLHFFTRLVTDLVSLGHLLYQRTIYRRRAWNWSEATLLEDSLAFRVYAWAFPVFWLFSRLDLLLKRARGFGLVAAVRKANVAKR
jgi:ubiquinone/menaquinone biosynthesis C-methylase UbiE